MVSKLHLGLSIYIMSGWMLPVVNSKILLGLIPSMYANWLMDDTKCIFTRLEHHLLLKEKEKEKKKDDEEVDIKYEGFVSRLCKTYNINLSEADVHKGLVCISFHSFLQCYKNVMFW